MSVTFSGFGSIAQSRLGPLATRVTQVLKRIGHPVPAHPTARDVIASVRDTRAIHKSLEQYYFGDNNWFGSEAPPIEGVDWKYCYRSSERHNLKDCALFAHLLQHGAKPQLQGHLQDLFSQFASADPYRISPVVLNDALYSYALRDQLVVESAAIAALGRAISSDSEVVLTLLRMSAPDMSGIDDLASMAWERSSADAVRMWSMLGRHEIGHGDAVLYREQRGTRVFTGPILRRTMQAIVAGHIAAVPSLIDMLEQMPQSLTEICAPELVLGRPEITPTNIHALDAVVQYLESDTPLVRDYAVHCLRLCLHPNQAAETRSACGQQFDFAGYPPPWYEAFLQGLPYRGTVYKQSSFVDMVRLALAGNREARSLCNLKFATVQSEQNNNMWLIAAAVLQRPDLLLRAVLSWFSEMEERYEMPMRGYSLWIIESQMNYFPIFEPEPEHGQRTYRALHMGSVVMNDRALGGAIRALPAMLSADSPYYDESVTVHDVNLALHILASKGSEVAEATIPRVVPVY